jgi:hypothetical protein
MLSAQVQMPAQITAWITKEGDTTVYGLGISTLKNESDAFQQARMLGLENLAASLQVEVAAVSENIMSHATVGDTTGRVETFTAGTKQLINQSIKRAKMYGPYTNNRSSTYILMYLDKRAFQKDLNALVQEVFADNDEELDRILRK